MKKILAIFALVLFLFSCEKNEQKTICIETNKGVIKIRLYDETPMHRDNMLRLAREGHYEKILFHRVIEHFMIQAGDPSSRDARPGMRLGEGDIGYTLKPEILPSFFHKKGVIAAARESDNVNPDRESSGSHFYIAQGKVYTEEQLDSLVVNINEKRHTAVFNRLRDARAGEIAKLQLAQDYEALMKVNDEISDKTVELFAQEKLVLSPEQRRAYTTIGGIPHLDGAYTVFGEVVEGLDVVDKIAAMPVDEANRPMEDVKILKIRVE